MSLRRWVKIAREVVPLITDAVQGATSIRDARERIARRAMAGDMDDAIAVADRTLESVKEFVDHG